MNIYSSKQLGQLVRQSRRDQGLRQEDLAVAAGTGRRFIIELEKGKPTAQLDEVLRVLHSLGLTVELHPGDEEVSAWQRLS